MKYLRTPENIRDTRDRERPIEFRPIKPRNMVKSKKRTSKTTAMVKIS